MRIVVSLYFLLFSFTFCDGQITFEKILGEGSGKYIEETPDHGFIACSDSGTTNYFFKLNRFGNYEWTKNTFFVDSNESMNMIIADGNRFVSCGKTQDTSGIYGSLGYVAFLDSAGNYISHLLLTPGDSAGYAGSIRRLKNGFGVIGYEENNLSLDETFLQRIDSTGQIIWDVDANGGQIIPGMLQCSDSNFLFGYFDRVTREVAGFKVLDVFGDTIHEFVVGDTVLGGSLIQNAIPVSLGDEGYIFATQVVPFVHTTERIYLSRLDTAMNILWQKDYIWGISLQTTGIVPTNDSGFVMLLNSDDTLSLFKINSAGDSLWMKKFGGLGRSTGASIGICGDGGFIVIGQTDSINGESHDYIIKTDDQGRILPSVDISISGQLGFCEGDSVTLTAAAGYQYLWSNGDSTSSISIDSTGNFFVTVSDSVSGTAAVSPTFSISVYPNPVPVINGDSSMLATNIVGIYQWYLDGTPLPGADSQYYTPINGGNYSVMVIDTNGCTAVSDSFVIVFASNKTSFENGEGISIFNNMIKIFPQNKFDRLTIYDTNGRKVFQKNIIPGSNVIDLNTLPNGIYLLQFTGKENTVTKKFSKSD